jgi:hypothetical protein
MKNKKKKKTDKNNIRTTWNSISSSFLLIFAVANPLDVLPLSFVLSMVLNLSMLNTVLSGVAEEMYPS